MLERKDDNMRTAWTRFRLFSQGSAKKKDLKSTKFVVVSALKTNSYRCKLNDKTYVQLYTLYSRVRRFELFKELRAHILRWILDKNSLKVSKDALGFKVGRWLPTKS